MQPSPPHRLAAAVLALAFVLALPLGLSAQDLNGFFPAPGQGHVALGYTMESWNRYWRGTRETSTPSFLGKADVQTTTLWMRYGVSRRVALVAELPVVDVRNDGTTPFDQQSVQDLSVLAQVRLAEGGRRTRQRLVGGFGIRAALGGYDPNLPLDVGDGSNDALFRLVYQVEHGRFYFSQQVGFDLRSTDAPNQFPLYTETGFRAGRITWIASYSDLRAFSGTDIGDTGFTFPSNRQETRQIGARLYARITGAIGVTVGGFTTVGGRNTADTSGGYIGLVSTL